MLQPASLLEVEITLRSCLRSFRFEIQRKADLEVNEYNSINSVHRNASIE